MKASQKEDSTRCDGGAKRHGAEDRPEGEEEDGICQEGQDHPESDFHLGLRLHLVFGEPSA